MNSIVVLTYNRDVLPCLKAIKENTVGEHEVILVDNGNEYSQLYDKYIDKYIRIKMKVYCHETMVDLLLKVNIY